MYEENFSGGENGQGVKVTTKLPLVERLGKICDKTVLGHMTLLGVQVALCLTLTTAISTHAPTKFVETTVH
jgi:hypothetical protein